LDQKLQEEHKLDKQELTRNEEKRQIEEKQARAEQTKQIAEEKQAREEQTKQIAKIIDQKLDEIREDDAERWGDEED
jgi:hypothetical protein